MKASLCFFALTIAFCLSCSDQKEKIEPIKFLIGVSQTNLAEPWRIAMVDDINRAASKYPSLRIISTDAANSPQKQITDVNALLDYGIDLLIISPSEAGAITPVVKKAYKKIPVIILDRAVEGYDYTLYIGPDNESIGRKAGAYVASLLKDKGGRVLLINGVKGSPPSVDRENGFRAEVVQNPKIEVVGTIQGNWLRDKAEEKLFESLNSSFKFDVVFAQNDAMAEGAIRALARQGHSEVKVLGVDGLPGPRGGLEMVKSGRLEASFTCPTGGYEAIEFAVDILNKRPGIPKKVFLRTQTVDQSHLTTGSLQNPKFDKGKKKLVLGFVQVGNESDWRRANSRSIKEAAAKTNIELRFVDGQQSEQVQKREIRRLIKEGVDIIAFSPRVEMGWDEVLIEAKSAGIPIILTDRSVKIKDDSLWVTFMGSDFLEEGKRAARWLIEKTAMYPQVNIVELKGTEGAAPTVARGEGFREVLSQFANYSIIDSQFGDFTYDSGKAIMAEMLKKLGNKIQVVFSQNDDMALGAIEAIENAGLKPGVDILIVSIDAVKKAFEAMLAGKLNCTVECNPLLGPQLMKAIEDYTNGIELPSRIVTAEGVYPAELASKEMPNRQY